MHNNKEFLSLMQRFKSNSIETAMSAIALVLLISLFVKAVINLDTGYDTGWYHLPFAARIWGIIPKESFLTEKSIEHRYDGFPLLAHFFQGLFWKLTGRVQATNLVSYFSIVIYLSFLRIYFQVPLYLSTIAIFSIPAVLTHSTTSFVDLPGNIGVSIVVIMLLKFITTTSFPSKRELLAVFVGALTAANIKPQLTVVIGLLWGLTIIRLTLLLPRESQNFRGRFVSFLLIATIASTVIFTTPIKNVVLYGNPVYPIKVEVFGKVLNHKAVPKTYSEGDRPQKWIRSVLEINTPNWSTDQYNYSGNPKNLDRAGGFFGAYVMFNLFLLLVLSIAEHRKKEKMDRKNTNQATVALIMVIVSSIFVANFPQSHELRYFMFWAIVLVSFNLSILCSAKPISKWLQKKYLMPIFLAFYIVMCIKIDNYYLLPVFEPETEFYRGYTSVEGYMKVAVKTELIAKMNPNERNCLIAAHAIPNPDAVPYASIANAIFYSSYFHPEVEYDYSIKAVTNFRSCGDLKRVP